MADPAWKRALLKAQTPEARAKGQETRRERKSVVEALHSALNTLGDQLDPHDKLGMEAWFMQFGNRVASDENKRALLTIAGRTIPQSVNANIDTNIVVRVETLAGPAYEVDVTVPQATATQIEARKRAEIPVSTVPGNALAGPPDDDA